jgi:DNA-directed RNA polymerase subunit RPC12/RpoP
MDIVLLLTLLLLIACALLLILYPLWQQTNSKTIFQASSGPGQTLEEYQAQYRAALAAIKDLTFDYEMGKVSAEDYDTLLVKSKLNAAKIRRQIDLLSDIAEAEPVDEPVDAEIEQLVASLRNGHQAADELLLAEVEAEIELLKQLQAVPSAISCSKCGKPVQPDDAFCSRCGQPVVQPEVKAPADACPTCGYKIKADDAFCAKCGTPLTEKEPAQSYEPAASRPQERLAR